MADEAVSANTDLDHWLIPAALDLPRQGIGEDAPPLVAGAGDVWIMGVFDGLGGAGSRTVNGDEGPRSSAYYAARVAREAVRNTFEHGALDLQHEAGMACAFSRAIGDALARRNAEIPVTRGAVRSSLIRSYPTTAALLVFEPHLDSIAVTSLWAGDSRCYVLTPGAGLQQLSRDDSRAGADPMTALREDGPMSNMLTGDGPCRLSSNVCRIDFPAILIVATDGSYGCLPSPMHFERVLLEALTTAPNPDHWPAELARQLGPIASDDMSLAAVFLGWPSLEAAAAAFAERIEAVRALLGSFEQASEAARRFDSDAQKEREAAEAHLTRGWAQYRGGYMALVGEHP